MIFVGIDPGKEHCAFSVVEQKEILTLIAEGSAFVSIPIKSCCHVLKTFVVNTVPSQKVSIDALTAIIAKQILQINSMFCVNGGYVSRNSTICRQQCQN